MEYKNIVLTGFMGSGKTTVGMLLAKAAALDFYDSDDEIVKNAGMDISLIFEKFGEKYFRDIEKTIIQKLSQLSGAVIATGGGVVKNSDNMEMLLRNGVVIYLKCSPEKIYENTKNDNTRPLLNVRDRLPVIRGMLNQRKSLYETYCHYTVDVSEITPGEAVQIILNKVIF